MKTNKKSPKKKIKLAYFFEEDSYNDKRPYIILGILDNGEFKDFYYSSGIEFENFQKYIPQQFVECAESTYEYLCRKELTKKQYMRESAMVLEEHGYTCIPSE